MTALTMVLCLLGTPLAAAVPHQDTHAQVSSSVRARPVASAAPETPLLGPISQPIAEEEGGFRGQIQAEAPSVPVTLDGFVLDPDGAPAVGAVVVTSAGGQAVVDQDGSYRMEVEIPPDAQRVQVTAVSRSPQGLVGSRNVEVLSGGGLVSAGTLFLAQGGSSCPLGWLPTFGGDLGMSHQVNALAVFDDGGGDALYAGGFFGAAGGVSAQRIAKWDGASWAPLGGGIFGGVNALTVFDDGGGDALYVGGEFSSAGGAPANCIAKWDGTSWSPLGSGMDDAYTDQPAVHALAVYDDGDGESLYAGGMFRRAGGVVARALARWDGTSWAPLGSGLEFPPAPYITRVFALTVFDDGDGDGLYAGGNFTSAGGAAADRIARWDGTGWTPLASGMDGYVSALTVFDYGGGREELYAGGAFTNAGGVAANRIAKWDGASWAPLGGGILGGVNAVNALTVFDDGGGDALYVGGEFSSAGGVAANNIAKWNGTSWKPLGSGMNGFVTSLAAFDDGGGSELYAGGSFTTADGVDLKRIAMWDGASWAPPSAGLNDGVIDLAVFDDGGGNALYAAGPFTTAGRVAVTRIAKWNGMSWAALGSGLEYSGPATGAYVGALEVFDDGGGDALYVGGRFTSAGGVPTNNIAKWNGTGWEALGSGIETTGFSAVVNALTALDGGDALYVGGFFNIAGGITVHGVAAWNGTSWAPVGDGAIGLVSALAVFDDGGGEKLYAGGTFWIPGVATSQRIAAWDGTSWAALGSGLEYSGGGAASVIALEVFDDGGGDALFVGGTFTSAGGVAANHIAKWNGTSWTPLASGMDGSVRALTVFDDDDGEALYVGGDFSSAGGVTAYGIAKWDGTNWAPLGSGMNPSVFALEVFDDGGGDALHAGGWFHNANTGDSYLAKWGCPQDTIPPVLACPASVRVLDRVGNGPGEIVHFSVSATDDLDPRPSVVCVPNSGTLFPRGTTLVECTATDASGNRVTCQFPVKVVLSMERQTVY